MLAQNKKRSAIRCCGYAPRSSYDALVCRKQTRGMSPGSFTLSVRMGNQL